MTINPDIFNSENTIIPYFTYSDPNPDFTEALVRRVFESGASVVELGIPFSELLNQCGGVLGNKKLKAVIPGGSSVPVVKGEDIINIPMDYESLMSIGTMLGSGGIIVMDESTCMVSVLERISRFYYAESCGQCTPCREGTGWLYKTLVKIKSGRGTQSDLDLLNNQ